MADAQQMPQQMVGQIDQLENQTADQASLQTDQEEGLWTIPKLMERYGIGKEPLYKRMAYLKIQPWRMGNYSYLDDEQLAYMDGLDDHIHRTGRMILLQKLRGVII
jgi:hypothetical protein